MPKRAAKLVPIVTSVSALTAVAIVLAGPLDPPSGPVAPTYKTLTEVEPRTAINAANTPGDSESVYRIIQPGSYYLTADLVGQAGKNGILIETDNVTIDLGGFALRGRGTSVGVFSHAQFAGVTIKNGTIEGWGLGIFGSFLGGRFQSLTVRACGSHAFNLPASAGARISDCSIVDMDAGKGITAGSGVTVERCSIVNARSIGIELLSGNVIDCTISEIAFSSSGIGIALGSGLVQGCSIDNVEGDGIVAVSAAVIRGCKVANCTGDGFSIASGGSITDSVAQNSGRGVVTADNCALSNCVVRGFGTNAFTLGSGCSLTGCVAASGGAGGGGGGRGFVGSVHNVLSSCTAFEVNGNGFEFATGAALLNCSARTCGGNGIQVSSGSTLTSCSARGNTLDGFFVASGSKITDCTASGNGSDGFQISTDIYIANCSADEQSVGAGINATSSDNRIEGNNVTDNSVGLFIPTGGNVIIRNSASGNTTNFTIAGGNDAGPIGSAATATSPWANIAF